MAENTNSYQIYLNQNKDIIGFCKTGKRINKKERDLLIEHGFNLSRDYLDKHYVAMVFNNENLTKAFQLGAYINLVATEELLNMYRAVKVDD